MSQHKEMLVQTAVSAASEAKDAGQQASGLERHFQALSRAHAPQQQLAEMAGAVARALEASSLAQQGAAEAYRALTEAMPDGMTVKQWLEQDEASERA